MKLLDSIKRAAKNKFLFTLHALEEMNAEGDIITTDEVRGVIFKGEIIEDYPEDKRGHSCLMFGVSESNRPIHVVCAPKEDYLAIITVYVPSLGKWTDDYKTRRKK